MTLSALKQSTLSQAIQICVQAWIDWRQSLNLRLGTDHMSKMPCIFDTLYLFCGRRTDRIKGLVWEGDGWLLLYKRLSESKFQWPRNPEEVRLLTQQQFRWLMEGLTITPKKSVKPVEPPEYMG